MLFDGMPKESVNRSVRTRPYLKTASAIGDRQMFPRHTKRTEILTPAAILLFVCTVTIRHGLRLIYMTSDRVGSERPPTIISDSERVGSQSDSDNQQR